jgi:nucleoside-diphosphate-sugar epimerase
VTTVVVGTGYTGGRLLARLPIDSALGLTRTPHTTGSRHDVRQLLLDEPVKPIDLPSPYRLLYTVPPATDAEHDRRLEALLGALAAPPERLVYLSTTGVYGDHGGETVTEQTPVRPATARAARRVAAESALEKYGVAHETEITLLRVPGIYGPDRLMIERIRDREPLITEAEANPGNRIHVDDLVAVCLLALDVHKPAGTFNVGDGDTRSSTWFAKEIARQLDWPAPPTISRQQAETTFSARRMSFLGESRRVDTSRVRSELGFAPEYDNAEAGIRASLQEMGLLN